MLTQFKRIQSSSETVNLLIGKLLRERNKLLSGYVDTVSSMPLAPNADCQEMLEEFGEELMAYPARLHFQTLPELEKIGGSQSINKKIVDKLQQTTEKFVEFHDQYFPIEDEADAELHNHKFAQQLVTLFEGGTLSSAEKAELFEHLRKDLSDLGETLGDHIALEDQLLDLFAKYLKQTRQISTDMAFSMAESEASRKRKLETLTSEPTSPHSKRRKD